MTMTLHNSLWLISH